MWMKTPSLMTSFAKYEESIVWKDNKAVACLNNVADPTKQTHVLRQNKEGTRSQIPCPEAISLYNKYMRGGDVYNSRHKTYSCSSKSKKWWMRIYYFLLDTAITNAYILYKETPGMKKLTHQEFLLSIIEYLLESHSSRKWQSCSQRLPAGLFQGRHFLYKTNKVYTTAVFAERERKRRMPANNVALKHQPLCPAPCFGIYLTKQNISRK